MAAPSFVALDDHPSAQGAPSTQVDFTWSDVAGEADNDVVYEFIYKESTAAYTATPSGWSQVAGFPTDQSTGGFKYRMDVWWRRRAGDTTTATWTWSGSTWTYAKGWLGRGGLTTGDPLATISIDKEAAQNTQPSNPGLTVARTDSGLIFAIWNFSGTTSTTDPAGFTERPASLQNSAEMFVYDDVITTPGATGAVAATLGDPEYASSVLIEFATQAGGAAATSLVPRRRAYRFFEQPF